MVAGTKTPKNEHENLDNYLRVRLTASEKKLLEKMAAEHEVSVSFYVRRKLFNNNLNMYMRANGKTFL